MQNDFHRMVFSAPISKVEHAKSDERRPDGRDICGKTPQNAAGQTIGIGATIAAERLIRGSLLRHRNTLRIYTEN
jgi:hypothetical protein